MKKNIFIALAIILAVFSSCQNGESAAGTPPPENLTISDISSDGQNYTVADYTLIRLSNLDTEGLYGIYPMERQSRSSDSSDAAANPQLITTNAGTRLLKPWSETAEFYGSDVGISSTGKVRILKYEPSDNAEIDTEKEVPLYYDDVEQSNVYEKYSIFKTSGLDNKENAALLFYHLTKKSGGARMSTDYGIIDPSTGNLSHDAKHRGVFDVSDKETIELFNQIRLKSGEVVSQVLVQNPIQLESSQSNTIKNKQLYEIKAEDWSEGQTVVMELNLSDTVSIDALFFSDSATDIRYASGDNSGLRHPYFFPLSWDETNNTAVIYIGEIDDDIIFDVSAGEEIEEIGTARLREIKEEEKPEVISVYDGGVETIAVNADDYFTPVIFEGGSYIAGMDVKYNIEQGDYYKARFVEGHTDGMGYTQYQLNDGDTRDGRMGSDIYNYLEYMVITNEGKEDGEVKLTFSSNDEFGDAQRLIIDEPADFYLNQDYVFNFAGENIIFEIKLDEDIEFDQQLIDELANFSYRASDPALCFTPVHYDSAQKTVYVDSGTTRGTVEFFVRSWNESEGPVRIGTVTAVEKEVENDWLKNIDVSALLSGDSVTVSPDDIAGKPYQAYRIIWNGNNPPLSWKFDFTGPDGSYVTGRAYTESGEYIGNLSATWKDEDENYMSGAVITRILFVNTLLSDGQQTEMKLIISKY